MAGIIKKKMTSALAKLENDKKSYPGLSDELDKKISALKKRMAIFEDPRGTQSRALAKMLPVLDVLEERLGRTEFVCGDSYSLADSLYTCTLARYNVVFSLQGLNFLSQAGHDRTAGGSSEGQTEASRLVDQGPGKTVLQEGWDSQLRTGKCNNEENVYNTLNNMSVLYSNTVIL